MTAEVERVLANWIEQAMPPPGQLPPDVPPARWVSEKFLRWWRQDFESHLDEWLGDAEISLARVRAELDRLGGWDKFGEALHECAHLGDALHSLRSARTPVAPDAEPARSVCGTSRECLSCLSLSKAARARGYLRSKCRRSRTAPATPARDDFSQLRKGLGSLFVQAVFAPSTFN